MPAPIEPLRVGERPSAYFARAHGVDAVPAVVPVILPDGYEGVASQAWRWEDPELRALAFGDRDARAIVALEVCRRTYAAAREQGAKF